MLEGLEAAPVEVRGVARWGREFEGKEVAELVLLAMFLEGSGRQR